MKQSHVFFGVLAIMLGITLISSSCQTSGGGATTKTKDSIVVKIDTVIQYVKATNLDTPEGLASLDKLVVQDGDSFLTITQPVLYETAEGLEGFPYIREKVQDCSGMFARYIRALRSATTDFDIPDAEISSEELIGGAMKFRQTGDLAKWYRDRGQLVVVPYDSAKSEKYQNMIKPGMVMFYGQENDKYRSIDINGDKLYTFGVGIQHMGVVVEVIPEEGSTLIERYRLFHGRNSAKDSNGNLKNPSAITAERDAGGKIMQDWLHKRDFSKNTGRSKNYPALGYATQQWVAIAPITPDLYQLVAEPVETRDTIQVPIK